MRLRRKGRHLLHEAGGNLGQPSQPPESHHTHTLTLTNAFPSLPAPHTQKPEEKGGLLRTLSEKACNLSLTSKSRGVRED